VNQYANGAIVVLFEIIMMVLRDGQKACRDKHDDELAHV
jgi:hypothetical protein